MMRSAWNVVKDAVQELNQVLSTVSEDDDDANDEKEKHEVDEKYSLSIRNVKPVKESSLHGSTDALSSLYALPRHAVAPKTYEISDQKNISAEIDKTLFDGEFSDEELSSTRKESPRLMSQMKESIKMAKRSNSIEDGISFSNLSSSLQTSKNPLYEAYHSRAKRNSMTQEYLGTPNICSSKTCSTTAVVQESEDRTLQLEHQTVPRQTSRDGTFVEPLPSCISDYKVDYQNNIVEKLGTVHTCLNAPTSDKFSSSQVSIDRENDCHQSKKEDRNQLEYTEYHTLSIPPTQGEICIQEGIGSFCSPSTSSLYVSKNKPVDSSSCDGSLKPLTGFSMASSHQSSADILNEEKGIKKLCHCVLILMEMYDSKCRCNSSSLPMSDSSYRRLQKACEMILTYKANFGEPSRNQQEKNEHLPFQETHSLVEGDELTCCDASTFVHCYPSPSSTMDLVSRKQFFNTCSELLEQILKHQESLPNCCRVPSASLFYEDKPENSSDHSHEDLKQELENCQDVISRLNQLIHTMQTDHEMTVKSLQGLLCSSHQQRTQLEMEKSTLAEKIEKESMEKERYETLAAKNSQLEKEITEKTQMITFLNTSMKSLLDRLHAWTEKEEYLIDRRDLVRSLQSQHDLFVSQAHYELNEKIKNYMIYSMCRFCGLEDDTLFSFFGLPLSVTRQFDRLLASSPDGLSVSPEFSEQESFNLKSHPPKLSEIFLDFLHKESL